MPSLPTPLRVVLCGRTTAIGKPVAEHLLPEYEVIHFIQSADAAAADLPHLLAGRAPQSAPTAVGTGDYSQPARAVIFGRGFPPAEVEAIRQQCAGRAAHPVAWVMGDPANAPATLPPPPDYPMQVTERVKAVLERWRVDGGVREETLMY